MNFDVGQATAGLNGLVAHFTQRPPRGAGGGGLHRVPHRGDRAAERRDSLYPAHAPASQRGNRPRSPRTGLPGVRIGDQIKSGDFEGTVENIETRATSIVTYDGRRIVMPNSTLFTNPVTVNTAREKRRLEYDVKLPKDADVPKIRHLILRTIMPLPHVLDEPSPDVLVIAFACVERRAR